MSPTLDTESVTCGMDVIDAIYGRRSVRAYTDRAVDAATVKRLIDCAIQAPSALNAQPWTFVVVQDTSSLRQLSERAKALSLAQMQPGTPLWEHRAEFEDPHYSVFYDASTLIVVCAAPGSWHVAEDCCLAAQNLMLAAHGLGLGTCPIGLAREALGEREARRKLGIPDDHAVVMPIVVGYPREQPARPPRRPARILSWR